MKLGFVLASLLFLTGCGGTYWKDRANDFGDIVHADFAVGNGLGIRAKAAVVHTGLGWGQMYHCGILKQAPGQHNVQAARSEKSGAFLIRSSEQIMAGTPDPHGGDWDDAQATVSDRCWLIHLPGMDAKSAEPDTKWWDALDCELGIDAAMVGFRYGVRPGQILDFVLGWFAVDFARDDTPRPAPVQSNSP